MSDHQSQTIPQLVDAARHGKLSRRKLLIALSGIGLTGAGAAAIAAVASRRAGVHAAQQHLQLHEQHIAHQVRGDIEHMMADYHENAVVEDPLFAEAFVGKDAIAGRFAAEVASVPDRSLRIINRVVSGDDLIVEWEATGTHAGDFLGFGGTGRPFLLTGVTVVTRREGKIVRESHYYDPDDLRRQVESAPA
jgi:steroid delta-isomerase-like uncharacterized protein